MANYPVKEREHTHTAREELAQKIERLNAAEFCAVYLYLCFLQWTDSHKAAPEEVHEALKATAARAARSGNMAELAQLIRAEMEALA